MKTKKILLAAAVALLAAIMQQNGDRKRNRSKFRPTSLEFEAAGGTVQNVTVQAQNVTWEYSVSAAAQAWMTVSQEGNVLTVSVADNNKGEQRTGQIRIQVTDGSKLPARGVTVTQQANANPPEMSISVNPSSLTFEGEGAAPQEVKVTPSVETLAWSATAEDDAAAWITVEEGNGTFTVSVQDNPEESRRTGRIIVTPSEPSAEAKAVIVVQEGKIVPPSLTVTPTDPLAWEYDDLNQAYLTVTAVNCTWTAKAVDEEGKATDWISLTPDKNDTQLTSAPLRAIRPPRPVPDTSSSRSMQKAWMRCASRLPKPPLRTISRPSTTISTSIRWVSPGPART